MTSMFRDRNIKVRLITKLYSCTSMRCRISHYKLSNRSIATFGCYPLQYIKHTRKQNNYSSILTKDRTCTMAASSKEFYSRKNVTVSTELDEIHASFTDITDVVLAASVFIAFGAGTLYIYNDKVLQHIDPQSRNEMFM
eukprot:797821_1